MAKICQVDGSRTRLVWLVEGRVWRAWDAPLQAQHSSGSAAHRRPHPGLYRPNNTRNVVWNTLYKHQHPVHIHLRTHQPAPCCDSHQLPGQCGKQGPRVGALHCLSPHRSSEKYQCNFSGALGADVGTASHRPSQQRVSSGRSPNETFFLKRTIYWSRSATPDKCIYEVRTNACHSCQSGMWLQHTRFE